MHKVPSKPSLLFEILAEDDDQERGEKFRRMSISNDTSARKVSFGGEDVMEIAAGEFSTAQMNPAEVLKDLLSDLYVDSADIAIESVIGEGGFATVYKCDLQEEDSGDSRKVAMKVLKPDLLSSPSDLKEFILEANLLRKLKHRNIVSSIGIGASDLTDFTTMRQSIFFVQEYMDQGNLKDKVLAQMMNKGTKVYSMNDALQWVIEVACALHYLHAICRPMIIHRDLKLENILLSGNPPVAKLCDFGLHKRLRSRKRSQENASDWPQQSTIHEGSYYGGSLYNTITLEEPLEQLIPETLHEDNAEDASDGESSSAPVLLSHRIFRDSAVDCDVDTDDSDERGHGGNLFGHLIEGQSVNTSSTSTGSVPVPASWTTAGSAPKIAIPQNKNPLTNTAEGGVLGGLKQQLKLVNSRSGHSMHLTQKVGSTVYMAPEVTLGGKYNEKVDVFSFGVIVYEVFMQSVILVKHAMLRDGEDMTNYSERVAQGHRETIPSYWPSPIRNLIERCWSSNHHDRPSFRVVIDDLLKIQSDGVIHALSRSQDKVYSPINDCGCCNIV